MGQTTAAERVLFALGGVEKGRLNSPSEPNAYSDSQIRPVGTR